MTLRKDAMEILRVFNNNVVLAKGGDGGEVILTGRGLGFQAAGADGRRVESRAHLRAIGRA